jgi:ABC-type nitrate/sulfonate/bicarbonate transport system substrate-binding protein
MVRGDSPVQRVEELRGRPIAVTWHAGTFYAVIEALEAAGVPFGEIKLVHANDRLAALLNGEADAAGLMEPLVSRALAAGARKVADLAWRGGIVASHDLDEATAAKLLRALNRAVEWLRQAESRQREQLLRDLSPDQRQSGLLPELLGATPYERARFERTADWMVARGFLRPGADYDQVVRSS